jgi:dTMP kinase
MDASERGILIAVEGIDGAGKTTQVARLRDALVATGEAVTASREPTDGRWGRSIRESAQNGRMELDEELEAFIQDRQEHVAKKINPALKRGEIVILDRYFYLTIAYQGARGNGVERLDREMREWFPVPDVVLLIDTHPAIAVERIIQSRGDVPNHFERQEYLESVRAIFLQLAKKDAEIHVLNGHLSIDELFQSVAHTLLNSVLKPKRCAKSWDCDMLYCSYRINGECRWWELSGRLASAGRPS